ncbi:hypothetical protein WKR88_13845 [Trinickia caryophylli]|uniref:hypothetical protein n=1 Tax=Trinickia caryophylli TaxID=28094 RepID=UPI001E4006B5|nr:hypothetical protein [Trinickia caryophylli]
MLVLFSPLVLKSCLRTCLANARLARRCVFEVVFACPAAGATAALLFSVEEVAASVWASANVGTQTAIAPHSSADLKFIFFTLGSLCEHVNMNVHGGAIARDEHSLRRIGHRD